MRFIVISDTHGQHRKLQLPEGDIIIHAGDFCHFGNEDNLYDFLDWYDDLKFNFKILIAGNHDFFAAEHSIRFKEIIPEGITYLDDSGTSINDIKIWGSPVQPDLIGWAFGKNRGKEMKYHWDLIPEDIDILITHTPPYGILDKTRFGKSIGCEELSIRLKSLAVKIHIFGHVHESYGETIIGNTIYMNGSNINSSKGLVNPPKVFEFNK